MSSARLASEKKRLFTQGGERVAVQDGALERKEWVGRALVLLASGAESDRVRTRKKISCTLVLTTSAQLMSKWGTRKRNAGSTTLGAASTSFVRRRVLACTYETTTSKLMPVVGTPS